MAPPGGSTRDVLHVAVLQTDPTAGSTAQNLARASALVDRLVTEARGTLGLLVAPEIGFGRYILDAKGARAAARDEGQILAWAAAVARALGCHVCVGHVRADARTGEMYNSQTTLDDRGERIVVYDKTHLYFVDEKWAVESKTGFAQTSLSLKVMRTTTDRGGDDDAAATTTGRGDDAKRSDDARKSDDASTTRRVAVAVTNAICMDINPYRFEAPWHAHELARAAAGSDLIVFSSAWTSAHPDDPSETKAAPVDPSQVLSYWVARLEPLLGARDAPVFVCANRVGVEDEIQFTGCSCVIDLRQRAPRVLTVATDGKESIRTCLVPLGPPDDDGDDDDEEEEEEDGDDEGNDEEGDGDVGEETLGHGAGTPQAQTTT